MKKVLLMALVISSIFVINGYCGHSGLWYGAISKDVASIGDIDIVDQYIKDNGYHKWLTAKKEEPKVGETWLVGAKYSWGKAVVKVTIKDGDYYTVQVIASQHSQIDSPGNYWTYYDLWFIQKIKGVEK